MFIHPPQAKKGKIKTPIKVLREAITEKSQSYGSMDTFRTPLSPSDRLTKRVDPFEITWTSIEHLEKTKNHLLQLLVEFFSFHSFISQSLQLYLVYSPLTFIWDLRHLPSHFKSGALISDCLRRFKSPSWKHARGWFCCKCHIFSPPNSTPICGGRQNFSSPNEYCPTGHISCWENPSEVLFSGPQDSLGVMFREKSVRKLWTLIMKKQFGATVDQYQHIIASKVLDC